MQTTRMLEPEWRQVFQESVGMGTEEDESSTECIWAVVFHHVMAHSCLAHILKIINHLFVQFSIFLLGHGKLWVTGTPDTESVDTGA
jgi:hypothetical protein